MNRSNPLVIRQATIAQILGYGRTTTNKAVRLLEEERWVQAVKVGTGKAHIGNFKVMWADKSGKCYGSFFAEVVVSEEEQSKTVEEMESAQIKHLPIISYGSVPIDDGAELPPDRKELLHPDEIEFPRSATQGQSNRKKIPKNRISDKNPIYIFLYGFLFCINVTMMAS